MNRNPKGSNVPRQWTTFVEGAMTSALEDWYDERIAGVLSCYDRVVITGTLPTVCHADGMTRFLFANGIQIFKYPEFAMTLRERVREQVAAVVAESGITIEHIAKSHIRKEEVVAKVLKQRGDHPGLVHVLSAMEACPSCRPWHDKASHKAFPRLPAFAGAGSHRQMSALLLLLHGCGPGPDLSARPHMGAIPAAIPLQRPQLAGPELTAESIGYTTAGNAFVRIDNWQRARELADGFSPDLLHRVLDRYAALCCPVLDVSGQAYHWSLMQVEYATDLVFRSAATLQPLYGQFVRESVLNVKAEQVATFLGRKITPQLAQEVGSQFSTRIEGTCIKHRFGSASVKMYDKFGCVSRIGTTNQQFSLWLTVGLRLRV